jgi:hypothetical protein
MSRFTFAIALAVILLGLPGVAQITPAPASNPAQNKLHINVIEGEDGVNVISQRTAVTPIVEVRDKNDQPVAGALVTFGIRRGRATFNNARTLVVRTDASGRAAANGFSPTAAGPLQISVTAAFAGEVATAIVAQTSVMTAAQAAAVAGGAAGASGTAGSGIAGAAAAGGAAAGGAGLSSAALIGIIAGAGAGTTAAVVATQKGGSDESTGGTGSSNPNGSCSYSLSPTSQSVSAIGGTSVTTLTASCSWSATSDASWLTLGSSSGSSGAALSYTAAINAASDPRTGHITVSGAGGSAVLTVTQGASTTAVLSASASPNPVPFSGAPITDAAICAGSVNTWFYSSTIREMAGVPVTLTKAVDLLDGLVVNDLTINISIPANGTLQLQPRWCTSNPISHTIQQTKSGTDIFGHPVSVTFPTVVLLAKPAPPPVGPGMGTGGGGDGSIGR